MPVKGRPRELRPHQPPAGGSPSGEAFRTGAAPRGKPLELTGAFSPWGRRCPRPRPRTDEGRACGGCPLNGRPRELRPHQPPAGGSFSLRAKSRLRRLRSDTRLRAQPLGEAFRTGGSPSGKPLRSDTMNDRKTHDPLRVNARNLRKSMTPQERRLWYDFLKNLPQTVYRQKIIGNFIVDFYISSCKLVICLLYTSPSPRDATLSRMPSSA